MKKYVSGLTAIILAIAFCAYTKPNAVVEFKLLTDPVSAGIVSDPTQWSDASTGSFGRCDQGPEEIACGIYLNLTTMSAFYHMDANGDLILNDFAYANAQNPKKGYVVITEAVGGSPNRIIIALNFWRWEPSANGGSGGYVDITWSLTKCHNSSSCDYDWVNARD